MPDRPHGVLPPSAPQLLATLTCLLLAAACKTPAGTAGDVPARAQDAEREYAVVAFYNLENLFDTDDDPDNGGDDEFLPGSAKQWTPQRYQQKLGRLADVVAQLGGEVARGGPDVLGVSEVENAKVLEDLTRQAPLAGSGYRVVHVESPDFRGIDNGLLYRAERFTPTHTEALRVDLGLRDDGTPRTTRDILYVRGDLAGGELHVLVNHWPSRRGGEAASRPGRAAAARVARRVVDSLRALDPAVDIALVGDFNDDPVSPSLAEVLAAADRRGDAGQTGLYNPMHALYRRGDGSLGYRDSWNLFDQVIVSEGLARDEAGGWRLRDAKVFRRGFLLQPAGRFKGYPLRTYVGDDYRAGYSDHLPVYAVLERPARSS